MAASRCLDASSAGKGDTARPGPRRLEIGPPPHVPPFTSSSSRRGGNLARTVAQGGTMKLPRRAFSQMVAGAAALPVVSRIARAQAYPVRPARIIVGVPPGGGMDLIARIIGQSLSERLRQPPARD